jgi:hypothetical protein
MCINTNQRPKAFPVMPFGIGLPALVCRGLWGKLHRKGATNEVFTLHTQAPKYIKVIQIYEGQHNALK